MSLKDDLADSWAETLEGLLPAGSRVYGGRRDGDVEPPYSVVVVKSLEKTEGLLNRYYAQVRVVHVSEIGDSKSADHNARVGAIHALLDSGFPERGKDVERKLEVDGWELEEVADAIDRDEDVWGDVFVIRCGCGRG